MKAETLQPATMNCDALAPYYEFLEHLSFGKQLERMRFAFLSQATSAQTAIICGGGDGRYLAQLLRWNPCVEVDFVDASPRMVAITKERISILSRADQSRVSFHTGDLRALALRQKKYDLIVTHFFLDCFSDVGLAEIVAVLSARAAPGALWVVSDFSESPDTLGHFCSRAIIRALYAAFRVTTGLRVTRLPDYNSALANAGYLQRREQTAIRGLLHSSLWVREAV